MGIINLLDENTINQIAAGEVIERPASVVKELIENAIDAMATSVTVEIKEGGVSFIRITDNGMGIAKDDVETAFLRHATSKIKSAVDLISVSSLGFRGEALSSIAAVSMVELITKRRDDFLGTRYEISGGIGKKPEEIGAPDGTTFIVRNLFYNTPARKKFLKTSMTEAGYINDIVTRMAMSHPEVSIRFINNGRDMLHTSGNGNLKDVIYDIYGREIANNLIELNVTKENIKIQGFIGKPLISRGNRTYENYFINGRYIKSSLINKAIEEGYRNYMMQHKYPFTAVRFFIEPEYLDVNVHPAKLELRFRNYDEIYPLIIKTIAEGLQQNELIVAVTLDDDSGVREKKPVETKPLVERNVIPESIKNKVAPVMPAPQVKVTFSTPENEDEPVVIENVEKKTAEVHEEKAANYHITKEDICAVPKAEEKPEKPEQLTMFDDKLLSKTARVNHKIIGQVFDTYWIVEYGDKMFIIDQHAAHEKVLYERTMKRLKCRETLSQNLNPPIILNLNLREVEIIREYMDYFNELGYEIDEFGGNEYAVRAVPFDLFSVGKKELLMEIIDDLSDDEGIRRKPEMIVDRVATMSCKAAVKGNNRLSFQEAEALIDELLSIDNPYNCPHGRPTIISMSKNELEKKFKRII